MHINQARTIIESGLPVNVRAITSDGEIIELDDAVCVHNHWRGGVHTFKVEGGLRAVRDTLIIEVNNEEVNL